MNETDILVRQQDGEWKRCVRCGRFLPPRAFPERRESRGGRAATCRACLAAAMDGRRRWL